MDLETTIFIHEYLAEYFDKSEDPISPVGIKDQNLLESAIARPFSSVGGKDAFESDMDKASALFHGIINNHPFCNGNKRTALLATLYYLGENGFVVDKCNDDEMFEFTRQIAAHEIAENREDELSEISSWLSKNSRRHVKGEKPLKYDQLKSILQNFDFEVSLQDEGIHIYGNHIHQNNPFRIILKGKYGAEDYDIQYISKIRKELNLTYEYGIDSAKFYGRKGITEDLNEFMEMRYEVMRKLAKI